MTASKGPDPDTEAQATEASDAGPTAEAVESRAHLLPEEEAAGSDDPERQAEAILEESEARVLEGAHPPGGAERRRSEDTVAPDDREPA